jgi:excisionase family DNA binding protein
MQQTYLTTPEAAEYIRLSRRTLEGFRVRGGGPVFVKAGKRCLYRLSDLDDWMASNLRKSTSDPGHEQDRAFQP